MTGVAIFFLHRSYWLADYYAARGQWLMAAQQPNPHQAFFVRDYVISLRQGITAGDAVAAMGTLEVAINRRPLDYFLRLAYADAAVGFLHQDENFLNKALEQIEKAIKISPKRQDAYYVLAKLRTAAGDLVGMEAAMKKAIMLDPDSGASHFLYGLFLLQLGEIERGSTELVLSKNFGYEATIVEAKLAAGYYGDAGFYKEAIEFYRLARKNNNYPDQEALLKLGLVYYYANDRVRARATFIKLLGINKDFFKTADYKQIEPILRELNG